eukprot:1371560-Pyramimonas_sp.AAC.1
MAIACGEGETEPGRLRGSSAGRGRSRAIAPSSRRAAPGTCRKPRWPLAAPAPGSPAPAVVAAAVAAPPPPR